MLPDEEFRSRLRDDLRARPAQPVGSLTADSLAAGRRLRKRQRTLRVVGGTAAVTAVVVGSVAVSNSFGSATSAAGSATTPAATSSPSGHHPTTAATLKQIAIPIPSSWTVQPYTAVTDPDWVTPQAIVAELQELLPAGTPTAKFSGDYAWAGGDRAMWAVDGKLAVTMPKGTAYVRITLGKAGVGSNRSICTPSTTLANGSPLPTAMAGVVVHDVSPCGEKFLADGTHIVVQHKWGSDKGAYVSILRPDGMGVQATTDDVNIIDDDTMFALAADGVWQIKMDKTFVKQADDTVKGDFMAVPKV